MEPEKDLKARIKRRTNAHVVRLKAKQGKLPPIAEDDEISESELPPYFMLISDHGVKPLSLTLKLAPLENEGKRKRLPSDPPLPTLKLIARRKQSPELDLADIFESIVQKLINFPEAGTFVRPVATFQSSGYLDVVKSPIFLEQILEKTKKLEYKTIDSFLKDIRLIHENSALYNGESHAISVLAEKLVAKCENLINDDFEKIRLAEIDIVKELEHRKSQLNSISSSNMEQLDIMDVDTPANDRKYEKCELTDF